MGGERDLQKLVSVHFMSRELGEYLISNRPGMLFFIFNTGGIGVLVAHDLVQGEFVLQIPYYPPQQSLSDFSPEMCKMLIFNLVGHELSDLDVADIKPWVMHVEVAEKFMCCEKSALQEIWVLITLKDSVFTFLLWLTDPSVLDSVCYSGNAMVGDQILIFARIIL